jgi:hypothetical protein
MALIEGVDYELTNVDYDEHYRIILHETYDTDSRSEYEPLWYFLDVVFDRGAREPIDLTVELVFQEAQDFCDAKGITNIPTLYKEMFDCRSGFLAQAKMPMVMSTIWFDRFHSPIPVKVFHDSVLDEFVLFLKQHGNSRQQIVLNSLQEFVGGKNVHI